MTLVKRTNIAWYADDVAAIESIRLHLETTRAAGSKAPTDTDAIRHALHTVAAAVCRPATTATRQTRKDRKP